MDDITLPETRAALAGGALATIMVAVLNLEQGGDLFNNLPQIYFAVGMPTTVASVVIDSVGQRRKKPELNAAMTGALALALMSLTGGLQGSYGPSYWIYGLTSAFGSYLGSRLAGSSS